MRPIVNTKGWAVTDVLDVKSEIATCFESCKMTGGNKCDSHSECFTHLRNAREVRYWTKFSDLPAVCFNQSLKHRCQSCTDIVRTLRKFWIMFCLMYSVQVVQNYIYYTCDIKLNSISYLKVPSVHKKRKSCKQRQFWLSLSAYRWNERLCQWLQTSPFDHLSTGMKSWIWCLAFLCFYDAIPGVEGSLPNRYSTAQYCTSLLVKPHKAYLNVKVIMWPLLSWNQQYREN